MLSIYKYKSDEELMLLIGNKKKTAFNELYGRYGKKLHNYFYFMLNNNNEKAEDFLHDLFLKIIEKPHLFDPEKKFSTWVYAIATNMCRNEYRSLSIRHEIPNYDLSHIPDNTDATETLDKKIIEKHMDVVVNNLNEQQKAVFVLRFQKNLSIKEISEILDCSEGTVKSRLFYSVKKITSQLKKINL